MASGKYPVIDNVLIKNFIYPDMKSISRYIDENTYREFLRGYVHKNMPIMTLVGSGIGNVSLAPSDSVVIVQNTIGFLVNDNLDEIFLYYFFLNNQTRLRNYNRGSGQPSIRKTDILGMEVVFPKLYIQKRIASILFSIDRRIQTNTEINENLLQQALSLFENEFVINSDINDELSLYAFADYINGAAFKPNELGDVGLPVIKIAELKAGITDSTRFFSGDKGEKYLVHNKDILFSWSGNPETSIDLFIWSEGKGILNQHTFNVKSQYRCPWFTFLMLKYHKPTFTHIASNKQTTGLGHVTAADLKRLTFPFDLDRMNYFEALITPIMDLYYGNLLENKELSTLRDTLLPKLMSGELDVSDVDF